MTRQHTVVLALAVSYASGRIAVIRCIALASFSHIRAYIHTYIHTCNPSNHRFYNSIGSGMGQIFAHSNISHSFAVHPNILPMDYWKSATNDWLHKISFISPPFFHPTFDTRHVSKRSKYLYMKFSKVVSHNVIHSLYNFCNTNIINHY